MSTSFDNLLLKGLTAEVLAATLVATEQSESSFKKPKQHYLIVIDRQIVTGEV